MFQIFFLNELSWWNNCEKSFKSALCSLLQLNKWSLIISVGVAWLQSQGTRDTAFLSLLQPCTRAMPHLDWRKVLVPSQGYQNGKMIGRIIFFVHFERISRLRVQGLPWWRSGWESACQCRGHGFEPWSGKIPHAAEQLCPWATITEPARLEPVLRNKRGRDSERPAHRDEEWPPLASTRGSPRTETETQHSHK